MAHMSRNGSLDSCAEKGGDGYQNDSETFLFTSESVGEGHPGKTVFHSFALCLI